MRALLASPDVSRPRQVLPGSFYLVTRRCTQQQFLLRPDDVTNNSFVYCLLEAAIRFGIDVLLPMAESNHHHTVIFDRHGRCSQFVEHFHKMAARCLNSRWGRWENLWASTEPCITRLETRDAVIDKLVYSASNPVKDFLVDKAAHWPGTNGYRNLLSGEKLSARRPSHFFRDDGVMPAKVSLALVIPPELGPADAVIAEVKRGVEEIELKTRALCQKTGKRILGRRQVLKQSPRSSPKNFEPRRRLRPRFAGSGEALKAALLSFREFLAVYRDARSHWLAGERAVFPPGTYWLARFAAVSAEKALPRLLQ